MAVSNLNKYPELNCYSQLSRKEKEKLVNNLIDNEGLKSVYYRQLVHQMAVPDPRNRFVNVKYYLRYMSIEKIAEHISSIFEEEGSNIVIAIDDDVYYSNIVYLRHYFPSCTIEKYKYELHNYPYYLMKRILV